MSASIVSGWHVPSLMPLELGAVNRMNVSMILHPAVIVHGLADAKAALTLGLTGVAPRPDNLRPGARPCRKKRFVMRVPSGMVRKD